MKTDTAVYAVGTLIACLLTIVVMLMKATGGL